MEEGAGRNLVIHLRSLGAPPYIFLPWCKCYRWLCYLHYLWNLKDKLHYQISMHLLRNERKLSNAGMMPDCMCQSQSVATTHLGVRLVTCCEVKQLEWVTNPLCLWCQTGAVDDIHNAIMEYNPVRLLRKKQKKPEQTQKFRIVLKKNIT